MAAMGNGFACSFGFCVFSRKKQRTRNNFQPCNTLFWLLLWGAEHNTGPTKAIKKK
jgi:hypothetical protein